MKKRLLLLPLLALALTACNGNNGDKVSEDTLKIAGVQLGYGTEWLNALINAYKEKTGIEISLKTSVGKQGMSGLDTPVDNGSSEYDLIFNKRGAFETDCLIGKYTSKTNGQDYDCIYADITDVYNSVVDENTTMKIKDKIIDNYRDYYNYKDSSGQDHYYGMSWANGIIGIVRNKTMWDAMGLTDEDIPLTTNEMFALKNLITDSNRSLFIYSTSDEYYSGWLNIFLAQYRGFEDFNEIILEGKSLNDELEYAVCQNFFKNEGMEETLDVMEKLLSPDNGYQHRLSDSYSFTQMQQAFLSGTSALFSVNGSWLEFESADDKSSDVDYIKTPIISSIVNKLSFGEDQISEDAKDTRLHNLIRYVDGTIKNRPSGTTEEDAEIIRNARKCSFVESGLDHECFIPCAAKNIDKAKDFLRFMYSDEGLNIYYQTMSGATLPAVTSTGTYKNDLSSSMSVFRKSINKEIAEGNVVRMQTKSKFFRLGGLCHYYSNGGVNAVADLRVKKLNANQVLAQNDEYVRTHWTDIKSKIF